MLFFLFQVGYETFGDVGTYKGRKDRFVPPVVRVTGPGTSPGPSRSTSTTRGPDPNHLDTTRPSIMRQSQSLSRLRKLTDKIKEDEKERKQRELERGEIRGLRRAKVHNMFDIFKQSFKNWVRGEGVEKKWPAL